MIDTVGRAIMEYCSGCGKDVSTQQEKRSREDCTVCLANIEGLYWQKLQGTQEKLDAVDGGYICRSCVRLIERYNSLHGELSKNVMQALPVLKGSNTISSAHSVSVAPGPCPLFSSANPSDSSGSAPVAAELDHLHLQQADIQEKSAVHSENLTRNICIRLLNSCWYQML